VRHVSQLHFNQLFSNNKVSIKNHLVFSYLYGFIPYSFTPAIVPLGILYLIHAYTSDGQHKELQQQQQRGQQRREQPECQPDTTPPPTLEQVLAMQAQMLQTIQQTIVNMQAAQPQVLPPLSRDRLEDF
jgi:hypothetical protein